MISSLTRKLDRWSASFKVARRFRSELRPHWKRLAWVGVLSVLVTVIELAKPWPIGLIFDYALTPPEGRVVDDPRRVVMVGVAAIVLIALGQSIFTYVRTVAVAQVGHLVTRALRFRIFAHLTRLPPIFHSKHKSGDLLMRLMGDVPMVQTMLVDATVEVATRGILVVGTVCMLLSISPMLTLAAFGIAPPLVFLLRWASNKIRIAVRKQRRKEGALADYMHEAIAATQTIQALGGSAHVVRRFASSNRRSARAGLKATRLSAQLSASVEALLGVALGTVVLLGGFRVLENSMDVGQLLIFVSYVRSLLKPVRSTSKNAARIAKGTACGERILEILDEENPVHSQPNAPKAPADPESLVFEGVSYSYDSRGTALTNFDAVFRHGQLSALVGRSGAGKSTATLLALRMMDPEAGRVLLDGAPLETLDLESVRATVTLSLQNADLFGESLRENLLLARPEATDEELLEALKLAGALDFITELPDGLDTPLGAGGVGLSGGQGSRLSLARTLLRKAPVLIVDEPFAGLDLETVRFVTNTLREMARTRIVIVIAHDLQALDSFDHVVFLDQGRAVAAGTHLEILRDHPEYASIVRAGGMAEDGQASVDTGPVPAPRSDSPQGAKR
ncbi:MAG: ATP-binding cassette subfamily B protein [Planctomycetota bacterium]|jgi:ATP-binding cassette subfamily B protein